MIIGLSGNAGSGKSTAARYLIEKHGFTLHKMAGPLKNMLRAIGLTERHIDGDLKEVTCDLLNGRTPRYAMQTLGTEWGRDMISNSFWGDIWEKTLPSGNIVVDDCRFDNEVERVNRLGGLVIGIERVGLEKGEHSSHASEKAPSGIHTTIINDGTIDNLYAAVDYTIIRHMARQ